MTYCFNDSNKTVTSNSLFYQGENASEKENVDPFGDNEWLRRNDTYQRRPIQTSFGEQTNLLTGTVLLLSVILEC